MEKGAATIGLIAILVVSALVMAIPVSAAPTADSFGVADASGDYGTQVDVPVTITNAQNGPIISIVFDISYDTSVITVDSVQRGDLTPDWDSPSANNFAWGTRVSIVYDGDVAHAVQDGATGSIVELTFNAVGAAGSTSDMNMSNIQLSDTSYNIGSAPAQDGVFTVTGDQFNLTTASTAGGSVTDPGEGTFTYYEGMVVDIVATPDTGYRFVSWTGDVGTVADVNAATTTITMNGDYAITANFELIPVQYNLTTASTAGGNVTNPGEGVFTYDAGDVVNLVATPDTGYRFVSWTGDVGTVADVNAATTTITMQANYSITANFEVIPEYDLTVNSTDGGNVTTPGEATFTYYEDTVVNLVATPDTGYRFVSWTGDVGTVADVNAATTTITILDNYTITANFEAIPEYDLTVDSTDGGNVTTPGEGTFTYYEDTVVNLVATPDTGYRFVSWTGDVGTVADVNAATTTITILDNYTITANFEVIPQYNLTLSSTDGGMVTTPGEGVFTYYEGTVVNLVATADTGYRFTSWTGPVADANAATTTITINADYTVTANFGRRSAGGGGAPSDRDGDGYTDVQEEFVLGSDPDDPCDPDPNSAACKIPPTSATPTPSATATPIPTATPVPPPVSTPVATPTPAPATPTPEEPGFEALFAVAGLLAIAFVVLKVRK